MKRVLIVLLLTFISSVVQAQPQVESSQDKVLAEARKGGYQLITIEELERAFRQDPGSLFFIDTRQEWAYQMQHITGAVFLSATPTWWYQYSPRARSDIRKILGSISDKKVVFY